MPQKTSARFQDSSWNFLTRLVKIPAQGQKYHVIFPSKIELVLLDTFAATQTSLLVSLDQAPIEFSFHLAGYGKGTLQYSLQSQEKFVCNPASSFLSFLPQTQCRFQLAAKQHYRVLNIYIPPEIFWEKFEKHLSDLPHDLVRALKTSNQPYFQKNLPMSCQLNNLVEQLFQSPYQGVMQQLYLEAKTTEILVRYLWELTRVPPQKTYPLRPSEREQIHGARQILLRDLANPPSLAMLARAVGLNPNKLNQGFRQEFGMTVFAWYRKTRIQQACELLKQGQLNIDETAQELGFYDTPHFIRLFKQHCGKTPGNFLKTLHS